MKKKYQKPLCAVQCIDTRATILTGSIIGGEIGGTTNRFDARMRQDIDDAWEDL